MEWAISLMARFGIWGVLLAIFLEYLCFPMPSELLLPLAGVTASLGSMSLAGMVAFSVIAGLLGSLGCYLVGRLGGRVALERLGKRFPSLAKGIDDAQKWQARYGGLSVMVARVVPLFRTYISFAAGVTRQRVSHFLLFSCVGILLWNAVLIGAGYLLGENYEVIVLWVNRYAYVVAGLLAVGVVFLLIRWVQKRRKAKRA